MTMHPLRLPGTPGAPLAFNGRNVTSLLKKYESICDNYHVRSSVRLKRIPEYCKNDIARELEGFSTWEEKDWEGIKEEIIEE
jgi:hypothetical protein